jgi:dephospho-CoA kinase
MLTIGLTGGIASGKSSVGLMLAARGARVIDADRVAHETYAPGTPGFDAVVAAFGPSVIGRDSAIDRAALGRLVFADPARLQQLTSIVWPLARARVEALREEALAAGSVAFVIEAVALREAGWTGLCDQVWLVRAPLHAVHERLVLRGLERTDAEARIAAQRTDALGLDRIDVVIENDGDMETLERQVDAAWSEAIAPA